MVTLTYEYRVQESVAENEVQYIFISSGLKDIVKAIQYKYVGDFEGKQVFNLGFGDYNINNDKIIDNINTANNDVFKVFNTVLNTIPSFFQNFPHAILVIAGSDSSVAFKETCKRTCKKRCVSTCMNADRRINIYRGYLNKHHHILSKDFGFYGADFEANSTTQILEPYIPYKKYHSVFVYKIS